MTRLMALWMTVGTLVLFGCNNDSTPSPSTAAAATTASDAEAGGEPENALAVLSDPSHERMNQTAPAEFDVQFHTSVGDFVVRVTRQWAPIGADRFYNLIVNGYYDETRFFRVAPGRNGQRFVAQWGIHGDPSVNAEWQTSPAAKIKDDPVVQPNTRGRVTFAMSGPNSRTTQLFISYADNAFLDGMGFSVFGEVIDDGMTIVDQINGEYEERPDQYRIQTEGNAYLLQEFPKLDHIINTTIVKSSDNE